MILRAMAKINLGLDVTGLRPDGYHEVRMIMQTVQMHDRIELKSLPGEAKVILSTNLSYIPKDSTNLAAAAADLLMREFEIHDGVSIDLVKYIPVAAGLAGGSSDAAAVLVGMNRLFKLGLTKEKLMAYGTRIGADVPYCILRGTALAEGIGERLTPLPPMPPCAILIAKPGVAVSTKKIYGMLDAVQIARHPDIDGILSSLQDKDLNGIARRMENVLEAVTKPMVPVIGTLEEIMKAYGAMNAVMSGSGPSVFGIFEKEEDALAAKKAILEQKLAPRPFVTSPYNNGGTSHE